MWSGGWQQWPIQQAMYQNVPHENIDWASLAKQWIDMQRVGNSEAAPSSISLPQAPSSIASSTESVSSTSTTLTPTLGLAPINELPDYKAQSALPTVDRCEILPVPLSISRTNAQATNSLPKPAVSDNPTINSDPVSRTFWNNSWESDASTTSIAGNWTSSAPANIPTSLPEKTAFSFGNSMHGNLPLQAQSYDYNHGSDPFISQQNFNTPETPFPQYWTSSSSEAMPPFLRKENRLRGEENISMNSDDFNQMCNLDAAKRKQLPIWIREGLEKMERDRQRQQEKERLKLEYEEKRAAQGLVSSTAEHVASEGANSIRKKSRFNSESEGESEDTDHELKGNHAKAVVSPNSPSSNKGPMTEEEMMIKVRRMLTEVLLEVTNEEVDHVVQEVYHRARAKAPARQLASSTALASITGVLGGLSGYGSGGSNNGDVSEKEESSEEENSDDELQRIIMEKKNAFVLKELEIEAMLQAEENARIVEKAVKKNQNIPPHSNSEEGSIAVKPSALAMKVENIEAALLVNSRSSSASSSDSGSSDSDSSETSKSSTRNKGHKLGIASKSEIENSKSSGKANKKLRSKRQSDCLELSRGESKNLNVKNSSDKNRDVKSKRSKSPNSKTRRSKSRDRSGSRKRRSNSRIRGRRNRSRDRNKRSRSRSRNRRGRSGSRNKRSRSRNRLSGSSRYGGRRTKRSRSRSRRSYSRNNMDSRSYSKSTDGKGSYGSKRNNNESKIKEKSHWKKSRSRSLDNRSSDVKKKARSPSPNESQCKKAKVDRTRRDSNTSSSDSSQSGKKSS